jgi:serine/threonine protein kinase
LCTPIVFGRYRLLETIASGGMGQVLLARKGDPGYEKLVVLKRILPHLVEDEEFFSMFKEEARIAMRLDHSNIARLNEFGAESGVHFIEMEYEAGRRSATHQQAKKILTSPISRWADWPEVSPLAHFLHRNVKPPLIDQERAISVVHRELNGGESTGIAPVIELGSWNRIHWHSATAQSR